MWHPEWVRNGSIVALAFLLGSWDCRAQTNFGQINGTVKDPAGQTVPGATVTLRNLDAEFSREATFGGRLLILTVPPLHFAGNIERLSDAIPSQVNEARTFDVQMKLGEVAESGSHCHGRAVNKTDVTIGTVIQQQEIVNSRTAETSRN
jgi:hypothetical protein